MRLTTKLCAAALATIVATPVFAGSLKALKTEAQLNQQVVDRKLVHENGA